MPQKQNIFKLFLIAVLCLASLGMEGDARASTIAINPDKTISINGVKTFPTIMYYICDQWDESK
jgi:hypothetical protein